ncbi:MAG TPA: aspartate kinase [Candidatus Acidoferrales bacterium]|nr:aspartate kinase [Candidatus Acidoferrales bacterium]
MATRMLRLHGTARTNISLPVGARNTSETFSELLPQHPPRQEHIRTKATDSLRIMKFGGTSVGDADCIERVVEIIRSSAPESNLVVVVSAMSGVTNKLIEAATRAEAGDRETVAAMFYDLRKQHQAAASSLFCCVEERRRICLQMEKILQEGEYLCHGTILLRELTLRTRDAIASLGERLSSPLVAAALANCGVAAEAVDATDLIVTDSNHGAAEPLMDETREHCEARLRPLLLRGVVPVVTGYLGASTEGVLTTLGRGGSDYSATILGAALKADEVVIWTDVDGVLTSDPRHVSGACTIPEISYREAAELAHFGAKVLHPRALRPVMRSDIPIYICNTFAPERRGTKITPGGSQDGEGVIALTAIGDVALITLGGPATVGVRDVLGRTFRTTAAVQADVLLISQSSSQNDISFVVPAAQAKCTAEALRHEFAHDLAHQEVEYIAIDPNVAILTAVGENMRGTPGLVGRACGALGRKNVDLIAIAQGSSACNISFLIARKDMKTALLAAHEEFFAEVLPRSK